MSEDQERPRGPSGLFRGDKPHEWDEFDYDVLNLLPNEGAKKGRYMVDALSVATIKRVLDPSLSSGFISLRLRRLHDEGLVATVMLNGRVRGWQRTKSGKELASGRTNESKESDPE
jgi:hypothetical protein